MTDKRMIIGKKAAQRSRRRGFYCQDQLWARVTAEAARQRRPANQILIMAVERYTVNPEVRHEG